MIFIDELYNMKLYKKPFYLPIDPKDKKKGSAVMLLTPNYESSRNLMNHKLITAKYYESYYIDKDVSLLLTDDKSLIKEEVLLEKRHLSSAESVKRSVMYRSRKGIYNGNKIKRDIETVSDPLSPNPEPKVLEKERKENPDDEDLKRINVPTLNISIPAPNSGGSKISEGCYIFNNDESEVTESYIRYNRRF